MRKAAMLGMAAVLTVAAGGCRREHRVFDPGAVDSQLANGQPQNEVHAGGQHMTPQPMFPSGTRYEDNAYAAAEGKRLFDAFNCSGCHQHGGGGIGPALMDSQWIYGSRPEDIYTTIVQGRSNGMPSFAGKIPEFQVWELVAYVRSMSGQLREDVAPARSDHMPVVKAEQARPKEKPQKQGQQEKQP